MTLRQGPLLLAALAASAVAGCHPPERRPDARAAGLEWPVPPQWKHETIAFPLDFAPDISHRGLEELRFPPHFFEPVSPNYWSYAFIWWLDGQPAIDQPALEHDLMRYFRGLCTAVGGKKYRFDPARFRVTLTPMAAPDAQTSSEAGGALAWRGQVRTYDPFATGAELLLFMDVQVRDCQAAGRRAVLFAASPRPFTDDIWRVLTERQTSLKCQAAP